MQSSAEILPEISLVDIERPWPGLAAFKEQEAQFFKGRSEDVSRLHRLVNRERLTVLFGVSGLGKSSLLQAGLFPLIRQDQILPVTIRLTFSDDSLNLREQVFAALLQQVKAYAIEAPVPRDSDTLWEYFHRKQAEFWDTHNRIVMPLLCFDQFEEIFTLGRESRKRLHDSEQFLTELADLIEGRCPEPVKMRLEADSGLAKQFDFSHHRFKLILSVREDYLANLEELRPRMPSVIFNRMRLRPMNGRQALAVVDQTQGRLLNSDVAESIVRLVAGKPAGDTQQALDALQIEPALLSLLCRELNERRITNRDPRIEAQLVDSNRELILEAFYQRCLQDQTAELRRFIEDRLLTVSGYRNSEAYDNALQTPGVSKQALDALVQRRLLVLRREHQDGGKRVELIHDVLTGVVRKSREQRRIVEKQRLDEQARKAAELRAQAANRRTFVFLALAMIFLLTTAWGWWNWWDAKRSRDITQSGKLAAQAALLADTAANDSIVERAAALAIESWRIQANAEAASAAYQLLRMLPDYRIPFKESIRAIGISPQGGLLAAGGESGRLRVFNTVTGKELFAVQHDGWVNAIAFSPDERFIATGSNDNQIRVIDTACHDILFTSMLNGAVNAVAFSPDGRYLAAAGADFAVQLSDVSTGRTLRQFKLAGAVANIAFSPDSSRVAVASADKSVRLIDVSSGRELFQVKHGAEATHVIFNADGRFLATVSRDNLAHVIDAESGDELQRIEHIEAVNSLDISADSRWLATGSDDDTVKITEISSGKEVARLTARDDVYSVRFSPNSRLLAFSSLDGNARLIETATWQPLTKLAHAGAVWNIVFTRDSRFLATVGMDKFVRLFETEHFPDDIKIRQQRSIMGVAFHPDGRLLATAGQDRTATVYDIRTGQQRAAFQHKDTVYGVAFSPDGRMMATYSKDHTAKLIDISKGEEIAAVHHADEVRGIAFSPDSRWLATASLDKTARVLNTVTGQVENTIEGADEIRFVVFSFDGQQLAVAGKDGTLSVFDTRIWQLSQTIMLAAAATQVAFSPDGRFLAAAGEDGTARLFNLVNGAEKVRIVHAGSVLSVAFSPDGKLLATGSMDNTAKLTNLDSGDLVAVVKQGGAVTGVAFSANGKFLATAGMDGISRIIHTSTGVEIDRITHAAEVWGVAFSPDEPTLLASALANGQLNLHAADPAQAFDALCRKDGRNLTADELHDYLGRNPPYQTCPAWRMPDPSSGAP